MVNILDSLGATRLRPGGALYWLPQDRIEQWQKVVEVIEQAGVDARNRIYLLRNKMDADSVRAVRDAIVAEIGREATRIEEEVRSGELGEKALEARRDQAIDLRAKIEKYENILGVGLNQLTEIVNHADQTACAAALTLSVAGALTEVA
jgi:hypothetical protein